MILFAYALLISVGTSQIPINQSQVQLGYALRSAESKQVDLKRELKVVEIELASRRSPQNLRKMAKKAWTSEASNRNQIIKVNVGEVNHNE